MRPKHSLRETKRLGGCEIKFRGWGVHYCTHIQLDAFYFLHCTLPWSLLDPLFLHPSHQPTWILPSPPTSIHRVNCWRGFTREFAFGWRTLTPSSCSFFRQLPYFPPCVNCVCEPRNQSVALCLLACRQRPPAWSNWQRGAGRHVVAPRPMVLARACLLAGETWWHHLWQVRPCVSGVPVCKNKYVLLYWSIPDTRFSSCVQFWEKFRMCTESYVFCVHTVLKIPNNCTHHGWGKWGNRNVPNSRVIATRDIV